MSRWDPYPSAVIRIEQSDDVLQLEPTVATEGWVPPEVVDHLPGLVVSVISAWNPGGRPRAGDRNDEAMIELASQLGILDLQTLPAGIYALDGSWAHAAWAVTGLPGEVACELGDRFGQEVIYEWTSDTEGLRVRECRTGEVVAASPCGVEWLWSRPCPMAPPTPPSAERCVRPGGPYGGAAIRAAVDWTARRNVMLRIMDCDVCGSGPPLAQAPGQPVIVRPTQDPAPHDPTVWGPWPDDHQEEPHGT